MRTQVGIIGGGPSGLLLSRLLFLSGIESVVLERQSREHVLGRIRAGVLESGSIDVLERAQITDNLHQHGIHHDGVELVYQGKVCRIDFRQTTGRRMTIYGQTDLTQDLYNAHDADGREIIHGVEGVHIVGADTATPKVEYELGGQAQYIDCDFVIGCDGYHGVSRKTIPSDVRKDYETTYPFGWLGLLSDTEPVADELIYAYHDRGFALCSMRSEKRSRYYIQVPSSDSVENWSDERFWAELKHRLPGAAAQSLQTGPSLEKSIAPLRSFVCEPMRWGSLFLVGDAAHIVPPTGAKGLNLAISDVHYLSTALQEHYLERSSALLDDYSSTALKRVWKSSRFSWSLTRLLHDFYESDDAIAGKLREAEFDYLATSIDAQRVFSENYVGLPF